MDVRSIRYRVLVQRIALGNSDNGLVEGYATVKEVIKFPFSEIPKYEKYHRATEFLEKHYRERDFLYGFVLINVKTEKQPFPYPKSHGLKLLLPECPLSWAFVSSLSFYPQRTLKDREPSCAMNVFSRGDCAIPAVK